MLKDTQGTTTNKYNQTNDEQKTQFTFWYIHLTESDMIGSEIPNSLKKKKNAIKPENCRKYKEYKTYKRSNCYK